ncbi:MAG: class I SAM-dependent methyltransferase [Spirochaetota bacterium]|nr:class I SAM-dependent methyltransferase [Spirochaetota bacterium]
MIIRDKNFFKEYIKVWDEGAVQDAPFITLGLEAVLNDFYGDLLNPTPSFPVTKGKKTLDLGCGWGRMLKPVAERGADCIGLDISEKMLNLTQKHLKDCKHLSGLIRGDGTSLPFKNNSFDLIYSLLVLQHLSKSNGIETLKEIKRVLKPGGIAYIRVPGRYAPENLLFSFLQFISINILRVKDPIRMRFYTIGEIKRVCNGLFKNVEITAHEFRPPWNFHTKWTWNYIIIPKRFHRFLKRVSDKLEKFANTRFSFLKHFGVVLMIKVEK